MAQLLDIKSPGPSRYYVIANNERGSLEAANVDLQLRTAMCFTLFLFLHLYC